MASVSGFLGGLMYVADATSSGSFSASVTVSGQVNSNFDGTVIAERTDILSEFDASVCVVIAAEQVAPSAVIQLPLAANTSGIPNFTVTFSGIGYASGQKTITNYTWFFNDFPIAVSGGQTVSHTFLNSGSFLVTLRVTDSDGFYGYDSIRILTYSGISLALPLLTTSGTLQDGNVPHMVDFTAAASGVTGTTILGYNWNFGHGTYSIRQNQNDITYSVPGRYLPVCTVVDSRGVRVCDQIEVGANN